METLTLKYPEVKNYVGGKFTNGATKTLDVLSPLTGKVISTVPLSSAQQLDDAVKAALAAFPAWSATPIKERVQIFYRYKTLLEKHMMELAQLVHEENGKTLDESKAEVEKSIELTEFACSLPQLISGELLEVSKGVECRVEHKPLGVVASIAPFNFPNMVPHWTIPNAIALG
ncbi:MAG: aldehyde dehydrogenase family protein, partial [Bacteroidia bacterium]